MLRPILSRIAHLPYADPIQRSQAVLLQALVLAFLALRLTAIIVDTLAPQSVTYEVGGVGGLALLALLGALLWLIRRGHLTPATVLIIAGAIAVITDLVAADGLAVRGMNVVTYMIPIALAGLMLPRWSLAMVCAVCVAAVVIIAARSAALGQPTVPADSIVAFTATTAIVAVLLDRYRVGWERSIEIARTNEERLRLALDAGDMGTWDWNLRSGRIIWGGHYARIVGFAEDEFDGRYETFARVVHPDDLPGLQDAVEASRRQLSSFVHEYRVVWRDGTVRWAVGRGRFLVDRTGQATRMLGVIADTTARKMAELRLHAAVAERDAVLVPLQLVMERAPIGMIVSGADFTITHWNPAAERIFGWSAAEMIGRLPDDKIMVEEVRARLPAISTSATTLVVESQNRRKDGSAIVCEWHNTPLYDGAHQFVGFLSMVQDVTERRRREQEARDLNAELELRVAARTAELAAKNRELEVFAYSVSHDLKAPLRGIDGYSRLLQEDFAERLDGDGPYYIEMIRKATASMGELIDDLLTYSRAERRALRVSGVAIRPLAEQVCAEFHEQLTHTRTTLTVELPDLVVLVDEEGLAQALRNLIENALKFSRDVPAPVVVVGGEARGANCLLWVRDNGIGFAMEYHDRIFELFQRLHRAEDYPGTGIGLAIVRKAVERVGGAVWAESAPGAGATFFLRLPLAKEESL